MTRRMIDSAMWSNENFAALPGMARLLLIGIINHADDQGRIKAHPAYLRSQIFPYDDICVDDIGQWLDLIAANGTAVWYEINGKEYLQLLNWWEYQSLQYAAPSDYPRPEGWQDRIRYNAKGGATLTCNWRTVSGDLLDDTCDQEGKPLPIVATLPPRNPGGRPPKNPPGNSGENPPGKPTGNTNKDQIEEEIKIKAEAEGAAPAAAVNPDVARVWEAWNANMPGTKSQVVTDGVNALLDEYSAAEIVEAIAIACRRHKRSLGYIEGILQKGVFSQAPPGTRGGDYSTNNGIAAVTGYLLDKGMRNGQH